MKPPVVDTFLAMEEGNDLHSPIRGNQILPTSQIQIAYALRNGYFVPTSARFAAASSFSFSLLTFG